jgi:hypothetical protein
MVALADIGLSSVEVCHHEPLGISRTLDLDRQSVSFGVVPGLHSPGGDGLGLRLDALWDRWRQNALGRNATSASFFPPGNVMGWSLVLQILIALALVVFFNITRH